jgi:valyl-tRNA synthetase
MRARYESWVEGLTGDWLISRQRYFGVPFPIWYRLDGDGEPVLNEPITPAEDRLPVDPSSDVPDGFDREQRDRPGGFTAETDVMDTWATSSLSPQIVGGWVDDPDLWDQVFPMDLRPQGHEIIRTWLFATIVRSHFEHDSVPWSHVAISGWVVDPDHEKMSTSKGNVVTPIGPLERYGADAVRYWAARGRPGVDTAYDEGQMKIGRRLAIKVLNVSRFVLGVAGDGSDDLHSVTTPLDRSLLVTLTALVEEATAAFEDFDYARALERTERLFWDFCDDYVELVKGRAYGVMGRDGAASAQAALRAALSVLLRLFAPFLPYVTEEVWSWWRDGSIHRSTWPVVGELDTEEPGDPAVYTVASDILGRVRKAKSEQKRSLASAVRRVVVRDRADRLEAVASAAEDVCEAGKIDELTTEVADALEVTVDLAEPAV